MKISNQSFASRTISLLKEKTGSLWTGINDRAVDHPVLLALTFAAVFLGMLVYNGRHINDPFYHDSLHYWELGNSFYRTGHFSFLSFDDSLRGYFFPFILTLPQRQEGWLGLEAKAWFSIYSAFFFAVFTLFLVPWFFEKVFNWKTPILGRLIFAGLLFFFWRGHFLYPLTDFPALAALLAGLTLLALSSKPETSPAWLILAGLLIGAAMNIRPVYQISGIVAFLLFLIVWYRSGFRKLILSAALFLLGCTIVFFPQWQINRNHFQSNSPFVQANNGGKGNLYQLQLFWGLSTQKYETNIGSTYPSAAVAYFDPLALKLPKKIMREKSLAGYFSILRQYPLEMMISYTRHAFNGLDISYPTPYVKNIFADHALFRLLNYLLWFLFICFVFQLDFSKVNSVRLAVVAGLLAPVLLAIPVVVEVRFFLPVHVLVYGVISYAAWNGGLLSFAGKNPLHYLRLLGAGILLIMIFFTLSATTMGQLVLP